MLLFLGNGGGGYVFATKELKYNGFLIDLNKYFVLVDPGEFDYWQIKNYVNKKIIIYVSHQHLDHSYGIFKILEYYNRVLKRKVDYVILPEDFKNSTFIRLNEYFLNLINTIYYFNNDTKEIKIDNIKFKLTLTYNHAKIINKGFIIEYKNKKIGYTSDTQYNEGLTEIFNDLDILIMNIYYLKRNPKSVHLNLYGLENLYDKTENNLYIMHHFGRKYWYEYSKKFHKENLISSYVGLKIE